MSKDGDYEVREYPNLNLVRAEDSNGDSAFRMLFNYISGNNEDDQEIAMTTPVFMQGDVMAFVMPAAMDSIPAANDDRVEVMEMESAQYAVLTYSGRSNDRKEKKMYAKLEDWLADEDLPFTEE